MKEFDRRAFLGLTGAGLAATLAACVPTERQKISTPEPKPEVKDTEERLRHLEATAKVLMRDSADANRAIMRAMGIGDFSIEDYKNLLDNAIEMVKKGDDPFRQDFWHDVPLEPLNPTPTPLPDKSRSGAGLIKEGKIKMG